MIYTVTLNPSLDRTFYLAGFKAGEVNRANSTRVDAGGKGLNVARALVHFGADCITLGFSGGLTGELLELSLAKAGVATAFTKLDHESRSNITIVDTETWTTTKLNEPGPTVTRPEFDRLEACLKERVRQGDVVAFCGSLPPGAAKDYYAHLIHLVRQAGALCALDTSGEELVLGSRAAPDWLKPNLEEAYSLTGVNTRDPAQWLTALARIHTFGVQYILMTAGERGAILSHNGHVWHAKPPQVRVSSTVGAGDASLAGALYAWRQRLSLEDIARWACASGTAAVSLEGSMMPSLQQVRDIYLATNVVQLV